MLSGDSKWSTEKITELKQIASQIHGNVSSDSVQNGNSTLVNEVEKLGYRINNLTEVIKQLSEHVVSSANSSLSDSEDKKLSQLISDSDDIFTSNSVSRISSPSNEAVIQSQVLRDHLINLSSCSPYDGDEESEKISSWKLAIHETNDRYKHILSSLKDGNETQVSTALDSWLQYLNTVEKGIKEPVPASREGLHSEIRLFQVHKTILQTQCSVLNALREKVTSEGTAGELNYLEIKLCKLLIKHKDVLADVSLREDALSSTIMLWEDYRQKVKDVQILLLNLEQEKQSLPLRHVAKRRLNYVVSRLDYLSNQSLKVREKITLLRNLYEKMINSCDQCIHPYLKNEYVTIEQRSANLIASIETWRCHLQKIFDLWKSYDGLHVKLTSKLQEVNDGLDTDLQSSNFHETDSATNELKSYLDQLNNHTSDVDNLKSIKDELVSNVTHPDARLVNQRLWKIVQMQAELIHRCKVRLSQIGDRRELWTLHAIKYNQFIEWSDKFVVELNSSGDQYIESIIKKLENDYKNILSLRYIEKTWLISEGHVLLDYCDNERILEIKSRIETVENIWLRINGLVNERKIKLTSLRNMILKTEQTLIEVREWLYEMEVKVSTVIIFQTCEKSEIDSLLAIEDRLSDEIYSKRDILNSVLSLSVNILTKFSEINAQNDTDSMRLAVENLESRWNSLITHSESRKDFISVTWSLWVEFFEVYTILNDWLLEMEKKVSSVSTDSTLISYSRLSEVSLTVCTYQKDIHCHSRNFEQINEMFRKLSRHYDFHPSRLDYQNEIKNKVKDINQRYHVLNNQISSMLKRIEYSSETYSEFAQNNNKITDLMMRYHSELCSVEDDESLNKSQKMLSIQSIVDDIEHHKSQILDFNKSIDVVFKRGSYEDCSQIEVQLSTYIEYCIYLITVINRLTTVYNIRIYEIITLISSVIPKNRLPKLTIHEIPTDTDAISTTTEYYVQNAEITQSGLTLDKASTYAEITRSGFALDKASTYAEITQSGLALDKASTSAQYSSTFAERTEAEITTRVVSRSQAVEEVIKTESESGHPERLTPIKLHASGHALDAVR